MTMYPTYPVLSESELNQTVFHIVDYCSQCDCVQDALDLLHNFLGHDLNNVVLNKAEQEILEHYYQLHEYDVATDKLRP